MGDMWEQFEKTGNVEDYLRFRGVFTAMEMAGSGEHKETATGSVTHGSKYHSDRNGVDDHACG